MKDYLVKALAYHGQVRAYAVCATESVKEAQRRHDLWVNASAALGRTMIGTVMLGAMEKGAVKVTVKIEGNGPIGFLVADADGNGNIRGYVQNPKVQLKPNAQGKIDVRGAVGVNGTLTVVRDMGMRDFFTGQVALVSGEIGEDFTYYFTTSEQIPSAVGLGVLVNPDHSILAAGGFVIQMLPDAKEATISRLEENLKTLKPISEMVREGLSPEEILQAILSGGDVQFLSQLPVQFHCSCSKERLRIALLSLGRDELEQILQEEGHAELTCHFCEEKYDFNQEDLKALIQQITSKTDR